jgi:uncharacterized membrane protein
MTYLKLVLALVPTMLLIDLVWIGVIMKDFYRSQIGHLMSDGVQWAPAVIFYVLFITGLVYFAILPGIASGSMLRTFLLGAFLGLIAYGTYDLTNHATLKDWPIVMTMADMVWGAFLSGSLAAFGFFLGRYLA